LIDRLDLKKDLPWDRVVGFPKLFTIDERIHGRKEGTVQPTSSLRNKLGYGV
jgi:hypothetical protein